MLYFLKVNAPKGLVVILLMDNMSFQLFQKFQKFLQSHNLNNLIEILNLFKYNLLVHKDLKDAHKLDMIELKNYYQ